MTPRRAPMRHARPVSCPGHQRTNGRGRMAGTGPATRTAFTEANFPTDGPGQAAPSGVDRNGKATYSRSRRGATGRIQHWIGYDLIKGARQLGQRTEFATTNPCQISWFHHQIREHGLKHFVTGVLAITFEPGEVVRACESDGLAKGVERKCAEQANHSLHKASMC